MPGDDFCGRMGSGLIRVVFVEGCCLWTIFIVVLEGRSVVVVMGPLLIRLLLLVDVVVDDEEGIADCVLEGVGRVLRGERLTPLIF